jgi:hypothetical protein
VDSPELPLISLNSFSHSSVHVVVVWDKWKDLTAAERARVFADAYAAAHPRSDTVVRLPLGLTPGEALTQGHLRYQIVSLVRAGEGVSAQAVSSTFALMPPASPRGAGF